MDHALTFPYKKNQSVDEYHAIQEQSFRDGNMDALFKFEYDSNIKMFNDTYKSGLDEMVEYGLSQGFLTKDFRKDPSGQA